MKVNFLYLQQTIIPSRVSSRGYKIGPVCVSVCVSVNALTAEPFDIRIQNLVEMDFLNRKAG